MLCDEFRRTTLSAAFMLITNERNNYGINW